jgi:hypothetical protein
MNQAKITKVMAKVSKNIQAIREFTKDSKVEILHSIFLVTDQGEAIEVKAFDQALLRLDELGCLNPIEWQEAVDSAPECDTLYQNSIHHNFFQISIQQQ